jgi:hypothetical protein
MKNKNCPECKNWRFDRQTHYCEKGCSPTYTTLTLIEAKIRGTVGKCKDMERVD